jgi:hypothetical protein
MWDHHIGVMPDFLLFEIDETESKPLVDAQLVTAATNYVWDTPSDCMILRLCNESANEQSRQKLLKSLPTPMVSVSPSPRTLEPGIGVHLFGFPIVNEDTVLMVQQRRPDLMTPSAGTEADELHMLRTYFMQQRGLRKLFLSELPRVLGWWALAPICCTRATLRAA